jgi:Spy/CpxP family protein refolding chaperone
MKQPKKTLPSLRKSAAAFALALLLGGAMHTTALAQGRNMDPEQVKARFAERTNEVIGLLGLTEAQEPKVREILEATDVKRMELFEAAMAEQSREAMMGMRDKMQELNEANVEALAEVLNEEQVETYKKYLEEQATRRPGGRRGNR